MARIRWPDWSVVCLLLAELLGGLPPEALSQAPTLLVGTRVRVHPADPKKNSVQGNLLRLTADSLHIVAGGADTLVFATDAISRVDVSRGRQSEAGRGALVGAGIGVGAGLAIGIAASTEECTGLGCPPTGAGVTAGLALIFGGVGAGLGALIGSMSHVERWEQVERPWVSAQLARSDGGVVVGVVVSW